MSSEDRVVETLGNWNIITSTLKEDDYLPTIISDDDKQYLEIENAIGGKRITVFDNKEDIEPFIEDNNMKAPEGYEIRIDKGSTVDTEQYTTYVYRIQRKE